MVTSFKDAATVVRKTLTKKYPQVSRAFIFGSFAEGEQSSASDLDIMVELKAAMGLQFISMIQDIEKATGIDVDIITIKQARELEKKYGYDILNKAKPVYERKEN